MKARGRTIAVRSDPVAPGGAIRRVDSSLRDDKAAGKPGGARLWYGAIQLPPAGLSVEWTVPYGMTRLRASLGALDCGTERSSRPRRGGGPLVEVKTWTIYASTRGAAGAFIGTIVCPPRFFPASVILQGTVRSTRGDVIVGVTRSHTDTFMAAHVAPLV